MRNIAVEYKILFSIYFILVFAGMLFFLLRTIIFSIKFNKEKTIKNAVFLLLFAILFVPITKYAPPYNRTLDIDLVAKFDIENYDEYYIGDEVLKENEYHWYCIYKSNEDKYRYNGYISDSLFEQNNIIFDTDKYTYLISIGAEIINLKYNVWNVRAKDFPILSMGKEVVWGDVEVSDYRNKNTVYVYKLKSFRIDNIVGTKFE